MATLTQQGDSALAARQYDAAIGHYDQVLGSSRATPVRPRLEPGPSPRDAAKRTFVSGRTNVQAAKAEKGGVSGFDTDDVSVAKAPDFTGRLEFEMSPTSMKPGDAYVLKIYLVNEGEKKHQDHGRQRHAHRQRDRLRPARRALLTRGPAAPARPPRRAARRVAGERQLVVHRGRHDGQQGRQPDKPPDVAVRGRSRFLQPTRPSRALVGAPAGRPTMGSRGVRRSSRDLCRSGGPPGSQKPSGPSQRACQRAGRSAAAARGG